MMSETNYELPLVVTNNTGDSDKISRYFTSIIQDSYLDTIMFAGPYMSNYFVDIIEKCHAKYVLALIDKNPPDWTMKAVKRLWALRLTTNKKISIKQRPQQILNPNYNPNIKRSKKMIETPFLHMKLVLPFYNEPAQPKNKYYAKCAFVGSVNLTKGGIENNDEILVILRDRGSIGECVRSLDELWKTSPYIDPRALM